MLAKTWLHTARAIMDNIEKTQMDNIQKAAAMMADTIETGRWVHTFGCGHATLPIEEMYPRIGGFVGFHPIVELPLTFFTNIRWHECAQFCFPGKSRRIWHGDHERL